MLPALAATLLLGLGAAGCDGGGAAQTPNDVQRQPGGPCQGNGCYNSAGTLDKTGGGTGYSNGSGDGTSNR